MKTIDSKTPYLELNYNSNNNSLILKTNIIKIDQDKSNLDNNKVYFVFNDDYSNQIPYKYYENGSIKFKNAFDVIFETLTVVIKLNNLKHIEATLNVNSI